MPPVPTSSSSSYRSAINSPTTAGLCPWRLQLRQRSVQRLLPDAESLVQLGVRDDERRENADAVRIDPALQQQQPALGGRLDERAGRLGGRLLRLAVLDELDRKHRAEPAHVADRRPAL